MPFGQAGGPATGSNPVIWSLIALRALEPAYGESFFGLSCLPFPQRPVAGTFHNLIVQLVSLLRQGITKLQHALRAAGA